MQKILFSIIGMNNKIYLHIFCHLHMVPYLNKGRSASQKVERLRETLCDTKFSKLQMPRISKGQVTNNLASI